MKKRDLVRHLTAHGCYLLREGGNHEWWMNPANQRKAAVPRHNDVIVHTAKAVCQQLLIPPPPGK